MTKPSRKRAGRKRAVEAARQPDGRVKPQSQEPPPELLERRCEALAGVLKEHPRPFLDELARTADAGWYIGRLFITRQISEEQKFAAERLKRATRAYEAALLMPAPPGGFRLLEPRGASLESDEDHSKRLKRAQREYERCYEALAEAGQTAKVAVVRALREELVDPALLRRGLEAVRRA